MVKLQLEGGASLAVQLGGGASHVCVLVIVGGARSHEKGCTVGGGGGGGGLECGQDRSPIIRTTPKYILVAIALYCLYIESLTLHVTLFYITIHTTTRLQNSR